MYSAWLQHGRVWRKTRSYDAVLEHDGNFVVCDTREDEKVISATISKITGLYTLDMSEPTIDPSYDGYLICSDLPIANTSHEAFKMARSLGRVSIPSMIIRWSINMFRKVEPGLYVSKHHSGLLLRTDSDLNDNPSRSDIDHGVVAEDELSILYVDEDAWRKHQLAFEKAEQDKRTVADEMLIACQALAGKLHMKPFRGGNHIGVLMLAHDAVHGRVETNRIVRLVAKWWLSDPEASRKKYRSITPEMFEIIEKRFRAAAGVRG